MGFALDRGSPPSRGFERGSKQIRSLARDRTPALHADQRERCESGNERNSCTVFRTLTRSCSKCCSRAGRAELECPRARVLEWIGRAVATVRLMTDAQAMGRSAVRRDCQARITIEAPVEDVWNVISDVTRVGEWSGECRRCEWVGDSARLAPGARFRGGNRRGWMRWARLNEVDVADAPNELVAVVRPPRVGGLDDPSRPLQLVA
jgi:hypothetical protein